MPSWRIHLIIGLILTASLFYIFYYFNLWQLLITNSKIQYLYLLHIWFISLLGSLLPDFDYRKTRIRHILGPVLTIFVVLSIIYINRYEPINLNPASLGFLALMFLFIPLLAGLVVPFKHHGKLHSVTAAIVFGLFWLGFELVIFNQALIQAGIVGLFGFLGYISHLILDWDLKLL